MFAPSFRRWSTRSSSSRSTDRLAPTVSPRTPPGLAPRARRRAHAVLPAEPRDQAARDRHRSRGTTLASWRTISGCAATAPAPSFAVERVGRAGCWPACPSVGGSNRPGPGSSRSGRACRKPASWPGGTCPTRSWLRPLTRRSRSRWRSRRRVGHGMRRATFRSRRVRRTADDTRMNGLVVRFVIWCQIAARSVSTASGDGCSAILPRRHGALLAGRAVRRTTALPFVIRLVMASGSENEPPDGSLMPSSPRTNLPTARWASTRPGEGRGRSTPRRRISPGTPPGLAPRARRLPSRGRPRAAT